MKQKAPRRERLSHRWTVIPAARMPRDRLLSEFVVLPLLYQEQGKGMSSETAAHWATVVQAIAAMLTFIVALGAALFAQTLYNKVSGELYATSRKAE